MSFSLVTLIKTNNRHTEEYEKQLAASLILYACQFLKGFWKKKTLKWHSVIQALLFVNFSHTLRRSLGHIKQPTHLSFPPISDPVWPRVMWEEVSGSLEQKTTLVLRQIQLSFRVCLCLSGLKGGLRWNWRGSAYCRQSDSHYSRLSVGIVGAHSVGSVDYWLRSGTAARPIWLPNSALTQVLDLGQSPGWLWFSESSSVLPR